MKKNSQPQNRSPAVCQFVLPAAAAAIVTPLASIAQKRDIQLAACRTTTTTSGSRKAHGQRAHIVIPDTCARAASQWVGRSPILTPVR